GGGLGGGGGSRGGRWGFSWNPPAQKAAHAAEAAPVQINDAAEGTPIRHEALLPRGLFSPPPSTSAPTFFRYFEAPRFSSYPLASSFTVNGFPSRREKRPRSSAFSGREPMRPKTDIWWPLSSQPRSRCWPVDTAMQGDSVGQVAISFGTGGGEAPSVWVERAGLQSSTTRRPFLPSAT